MSDASHPTLDAVSFGRTTTISTTTATLSHASVVQASSFCCIGIRATVRYRVYSPSLHNLNDSHRLYAFPVLALIFVPQANEMYYDLGGSLGFMSTTLVSLYYPHLKAKFWDRLPTATLPPITHFAPRQILLNAAILAWTTRLGTFLFSVCSLCRDTSTRADCAACPMYDIESYEGRRRLSL